MLLLLFQYFYVLFIGSYIGILVAVSVLRIRFANVFHYFLIGLIAIVSLARLWAVFYGTAQWGLQLLLLALALASVLRHGNVFGRPLMSCFTPGFMLALIFILFFSAQQSISYDEGLYHASFIGWLNRYGIVRGIANTHGRMGFDSSWHLFVSVFNLSGITGGPHNQLNGAFLLNTLCYFSIEKHLRPFALNFNRIIATLLFFPLLLVYHLIDPSADYIVIAWLAILVYELYYFDAAGSSSFPVLLCLSVVFLITVKLSVFPALLLLLPFVKPLWHDKPAIVKLLPGTLAILLVWVYNNYILTGYIVYPFLQLGALSPKWKVPAHVAYTDIQWIKYTPLCRWAGISLQQAAGLSFWAMLKTWFFSVRLVEKLLFLGSIGLVLSVLFFHLGQNRYRRAVVLWVAIGFLAVVAAVPDFRFYAVYSFCALAMLLSGFRKPVLSRYIIGPALLANMALTLVLYIHLKEKVNNPANIWHHGLALCLLKPEPYFHSSASSANLGKATVYIFDEENKSFAWDVTPSTYSSYSPGLSLLHPGKVSEGFYTNERSTGYLASGK